MSSFLATRILLCDSTRSSTLPFALRHLTPSQRHPDSLPAFKHILDTPGVSPKPWSQFSQAFPKDPRCWPLPQAPFLPDCGHAPPSVFQEGANESYAQPHVCKLAAGRKKQEGEEGAVTRVTKSKRQLLFLPSLAWSPELEKVAFLLLKSLQSHRAYG